MMLRMAVRNGEASPAVPDAPRRRSRSARALCADGGMLSVDCATGGGEGKRRQQVGVLHGRERYDLRVPRLAHTRR